jgi:hypothetical protein
VVEIFQVGLKKDRTHEIPTTQDRVCPKRARWSLIGALPLLFAGLAFADDAGVAAEVLAEVQREALPGETGETTPEHASTAAAPVQIDAEPVSYPLAMPPGFKSITDFTLLKVGVYAGQSNCSDQNYTDMSGTTYNLAGNAHSDPMLVNAATDYKGLRVGYLFEYYHTTMRDYMGQSIPDALPVDSLSSPLNITYEWKLAPGLKVVPRFHWLYQEPWRTVNELARVQYPDIYYKPHVGRVLGGLTATWDVLQQLNLLFGTEYYVDSATDPTWPFVDPANHAQLTDHVSYGDTTVYGQALLETPWANLSAGARYEYRSYVGGSFVPRVGFTKTFGPFHYKLLGSRAFRPPAINNLHNTPDVVSELTTVYELELGYKIHPTLFAVVNGFDISIERSFVYYYDPATATEGYRNYKSLGTRGAGFELRFKSERLFANLSYSYYTAAKDNAEVLSVPGNSSVLLGFSPHKLALLVGFDLSRRLDASFSALILGPQRYGYYAYDAAGAPLAKDFGTEVQLNAYVCYKDLLVPGGFAGLGIYNLANAKTTLIQQFNNGHAPLPGPSREVLLKVGYDLRRSVGAKREPATP